MSQSLLSADELTVTIGEGDKVETFVFSVPGPRDMGKIGIRAAALRRADAPGTSGTDAGLDYQTRNLYDAFAIMELHLLKADAPGNWPFSTSDTGAAAVLSEKFPPRVTRKVLEVRERFYDALDTFLDAGA